MAVFMLFALLSRNNLRDANEMGERKCEEWVAKGARPPRPPRPPQAPMAKCESGGGERDLALFRFVWILNYVRMYTGGFLSFFTNNLWILLFSFLFLFFFLVHPRDFRRKGTDADDIFRKEIVFGG